MTVYYPTLQRIPGSENLYDYEGKLRCYCGARFRPFEHPAETVTATCRSSWTDGDGYHGGHRATLSLHAGAEGPVKAEGLD